jgi:hypothetical protein
MTVGEILLESRQQKYPWIVEPPPKKFRFDPRGKPMVELDMPRSPSSAGRLSELQHVAQIRNLLAPDYIIYFDANSWIQGHSLFDDPHHLPARGAVQFKQRLGILLGHATLDLSLQSTAYLQGNSRL